MNPFLLFVLFFCIPLLFVSLQCSDSKNQNDPTPKQNQSLQPQQKELKLNPSQNDPPFDLSTSRFNVDQYTVGLWHFDRLKDDILIDMSSYENYAIIKNPKLVPGRFGQALAFDGKNIHVDIESSPSLTLQNAITIELWIIVNHKQDQAFPVILSKDSNNQGSGSPSYEIFLNNTLLDDSNSFKRNLTWRINTVEKEYNLNSKINWNNLADGKWHYIATTYDGSIMNFYLDGSLIENLKATGKLKVNDNPLRLSRKFQKESNFFNGVIDELKISNVARKKNYFQKYWNKVKNLN